jgi:MYXO-CTERM domain-containing protein
MIGKTRAFWTIVAAVGGVALAAPALACSCAFEITELLAPADGEVDVPLNARVWVGGGTYDGEGGDAASRLVLLDEAGDPVAASVTELFGNNDRVAVITPDELLVAGQTYTLELDQYEALGEFTVGDVELSIPPELPVELGRESSASARIHNQTNSCGPTDMVTLTLETTGLVYVAEIEGWDSLDADAIDGEASELSLDGVLQIGSAGCVWSWPDAEPRASTTVRWGVYDIAGNFSGWSDDEEISIPSAGCSCSAGGEGAQSGAAALLLGLVGLAVRRRHWGRTA